MTCKLLGHATHFLANPKLTLPYRCTTLSKKKLLKHQQTCLISFPSWQGWEFTLKHMKMDITLKIKKGDFATVTLQLRTPHHFTLWPICQMVKQHLKQALSSPEFKLLQL